ncbi:N-acetylglucosamine-6-phosphate deacetylase [Halobacillus andaensis]|nr:N-acetylglucosamine-6-phosphate deacetylase [Halobacillus andaensis]MBP2005166.1 N-acetylglucosamine-6-phosphate deacetylase [Halobacillus andaensis]
MAGSIEWTNVTIVTPSETIENGSLHVQNGKITAIARQPIGGADVTIDGKGKILVPGFIDVHIHGANGHDVMDATEEALHGMASVLPQEGTTSFLATTMTQSNEEISNAVTNVGNYMKNEQAEGQAEVVGIHLEGPFISKDKAGAQPLTHIAPPSIELFDQWNQQSGDHICLVTLAPEVKGAMDFITHVSQKGIVASIGHSDATYDQVTESVEAGARHVTHLYNQMSGMHHREPGVVGAAFLNNKLMVEMIVDHVHARPESVQLAYHHTKADRTILITDAMRAKCLPEGAYDLGGQQVHVKGKEARLSDGTLAGSILTLEEAAAHMKENTNLTIRDLARITSTNAAEQLGIDDRKGKLEEGKDADLVLLDEDYRVVMTICRGILAYDGREETR